MFFKDYLLTGYTCLWILKNNDFDRGYIKVSDWINDLCWYYIAKCKELDKESEREFKALIQKKKVMIDALEPSAYKDVLLKAVDDTFS